MLSYHIRVSFILLWFYSSNVLSSSDIQILQNQVSELLVHRTQLDKTIEELKIANDVQISALKEEIESLRRELGQLVQGPSRAGSNQQRNDHLTVEWLQSAVKEIKNELQNELSVIHSATSTRAQEYSNLQSEIQVLQNDLLGTRHDIESIRSEVTRNTIQYENIQVDVTTALERSQLCSSKCSNLNEQMESKAVIYKTVGDTSMLERRLRRVEKKMKNSLWSHAKSATKYNEHKDLFTRVNKLETKARSNDKSMFNLTQQLSRIERVQQTTGQLMESMSSLETRLDTSIPEIQKEISRLEFELAQTTSSSNLIRDTQDQQNNLVKTFNEKLTKIEENMNTDHALLTALQYEFASENPSKIEETGTGQLRRLVRDLSNIDNQYQHIIHSLPKDCQEVSGGSGEYLIAPKLNETVLTWCDQDKGAGGWTVIQRRINGQEQFNRLWLEYQEGFGSPSGEFWLGNSAIHTLTADNCSSLRVDLHDIYGENWYAEYTEFSVSSVEDGYRLWVSGYQGNASDALDYQNTMQFSTIDSDRDISNTHCAENYEGGWWFSHCQHANLNGKYNLGLTWFDSSRNEWIAVAWSEMKIRRRAGCK